MLCQNHFAEEDFTDGSKKRLIHSSVPSDVSKNYLLFILSEICPDNIDKI